MIELECEVSGVIFQGTKKRPITICPECAEKLRKKGKGPVQLLGQEPIKSQVISIMQKEIYK